MYRLSRSRVNGISDKEWDAIQKLIATPTIIMVYGEETVTYKPLMRVSILLSIDGIAIWRLYVYHNCSEDITSIRDWEDGLGYGEECPNCSEVFKEDDTLYSLEVITKYPIEIVE